MKTFSSIKELLAVLSREQKLITEIFEKRKVLSYMKMRWKLWTITRLNVRPCLSFRFLSENWAYLELDDQFLQFFEQILEVNEEINVSYINENCRVSSKTSFITSMRIVGAENILT